MEFGYKFDAILTLFYGECINILDFFFFEKVRTPYTPKELNYKDSIQVGSSLDLVT